VRNVFDLVGAVVTADSTGTGATTTDVSRHRAAGHLPTDTTLPGP
jgi:hypothetical protein